MQRQCGEKEGCELPAARQHQATQAQRRQARTHRRRLHARVDARTDASICLSLCIKMETGFKGKGFYARHVRCMRRAGSVGVVDLPVGHAPLFRAERDAAPVAGHTHRTAVHTHSVYRGEWRVCGDETTTSACVCACRASALSLRSHAAALSREHTHCFFCGLLINCRRLSLSCWNLSARAMEFDRLPKAPRGRGGEGMSCSPTPACGWNKPAIVEVVFIQV